MRQRFHGREGDTGAPQELSVSNGLLTLAAATFADDSADIVSSYSAVSNGLQVALQNGAAATPQSIARSATWTWPLTRDVLGGSLTTASLVYNRFSLGILERAFSALPMQVTAFVGFSSSSDPKAAAGQGIAIELTYPSTDVRRVTMHTRNGAAWVRAVPGTGRNDHFGCELMLSGSTDVNIFQSRVYPLDANFDRAAVIGSNAITVATAFNMSAVTHFFAGVMWDAAVAGTPQLTFDPCFWIMPRIPWE